MPPSSEEHAPPHLALFLLGAPRIEREGTPVPLDTRKALALLAFLARGGHPQSRDTLIGLLWPEYDESHARATLRRTLSTLNKALHGEGLRPGRATIALDRDALWVDTDAFAAELARCATHGHRASEVCRACLGPLQAAAELYRGDFLAGFGLRDSPEFDEWQMGQAQTLRRDLASALDRLARGLSMLGEYERAIIYARRWLALDRLHEPAHRQLMRLYTWSGQRAAALRQYRECVQVLERELGVAPLEETTRLYETIKENRLPPPERWAPDESDAATAHPAAPHALRVPTTQPAAAPMAAAPHAPEAPARERAPVAAEDYPLVGRAAEWEALTGAYAQVAAGGSGGRLVLLEGEAGIGKTRLAEEFARWARQSGAAVIAARCYEGETDLTYGPIIAALRAALALRGDDWLRALPAYWVSEVARLLPELASRIPGVQPPPPLETPGARSRFLEGVRQALLAACAGPRPGIFLLDDVQWADRASLELLIYLVRRLDDQPLFILATGRAEDLPAAHPLRRALADRQQPGRGLILALPRLGHDDIQTLVRAAAPAGAAEPGVVSRLREETEGVPLLLVEYLQALAQGAPEPSEGEWSLRGGVRQLLDARLSAVGETARQVLSAAAVIGRSFTFDVLRAASGRSEDEIVASLEDLMRRGLVREVGGTPAGGALAYDFTHEKLRALAYEETSLARRRLLHRRVAEALASRLRARADAQIQPEQIAHHYQQAGEMEAAAAYERLAGERARALFAHAEALAHLEMALALGHPEAAALHAEIGDLHTMLGEYAKALASYETAAALAAPEALARIEHRLGSVYARRGDWDLAESHLAAALDSLDAPTTLDARDARDARDSAEGAAAERARVLADWSLTAHQRGEPERARALAGQALGLAEAAQDAGAQAQAYNILGILATRRGDLAAARDHLERSLALAERLGDVSARLASLNNLALALAAEGDLPHALERAETALALCVTQGDRHREAALHNNLADLLHAAGRSEEALAHVRQAVSIYAEIGVEAGAVQPAIWKLTEW